MPLPIDFPSTVDVSSPGSISSTEYNILIICTCFLCYLSNSIILRTIKCVKFYFDTSVGLSLHPRASKFDWLYLWFRLHGTMYLPSSSHQSWTMLCLPVLLLKSNKQMTTTARTKSKQNKSQSYTSFLNRLAVWSEVTGTASMRISFLLLL